MRADIKPHIMAKKDIFTQSELVKELKCGRDGVWQALRELEASGKVICVGVIRSRKSCPRNGGPAKHYATVKNIDMKFIELMRMSEEEIFNIRNDLLYRFNALKPPERAHKELF